MNIQIYNNNENQLWNEKTFPLKSKKGVNSIPFRKIIYCELVDRRLCLVTEDGEEHTSVSLQVSFEKAIAPFNEDTRFVRCHKSFIVNMDFIRDFDRNNFLVETGKRLPIAQSKQIEVRNIYISYNKTAG